MLSVIVLTAFLIPGSHNKKLHILSAKCFIYNQCKKAIPTNYSTISENPFLVVSGPFKGALQCFMCFCTLESMKRLKRHLNGLNSF